MEILDWSEGEEDCNCVLIKVPVEVKKSALIILMPTEEINILKIAALKAEHDSLLKGVLESKLQLVPVYRD